MPEYLSAREALTLCENIADAHIVLCTRAHMGLIKTKAALFDQAGRQSRDCELPADFWWANGHGALDQNWTAGDFSTWIESRYHWQAFGVQFEQQGIQAILPLEPGHFKSDDSAPAESLTVATGKPRKRSAQWDDWIAYLALCVAEAEIFGNTGVEAAKQRIADRMAADGIEEMPRSTIHSAMNRTLEILERGGIMPTKR